MSKYKRTSPKSSPKPSARSVAVSIVAKVRFGQDAVQAAVDAAYTRSDLSFEDRALCTELVYGTLRNFNRLEFFLRAFLERFDSLPKEMGIALCVASYELFYTRVPVYATVDSFVSLVRAQFGPVMGKVTNGVLRNIDRSREDFYDDSWYAKRCSSPLAALACRHSVPAWLVETWQTAYGAERTQQYLNASSQPAYNTLRFNKQAAGAEEAFINLFPFSLEAEGNAVGGGSPALASGCHGEEDTVCFGTVYSNGTSSPNKSSAGKAGGKEGGVSADTVLDVDGLRSLAGALWSSFSLWPRLSFRGSLPSCVHALTGQGVVSQQSGGVLEVLHALRAHEWKGPLWDCCCGRGGKTLALLEAGLDVVWASDVSKPRLRGLKQELARLGMEGVCHVEQFSAVNPVRESDFYADTGIDGFGTILIDAPCSGFGTMARHPEIRFRRTPEDVKKLAHLQSRLLANAVGFLKKGGNLVYITCTLMPEENENLVAEFLRRHEGMALVTSFQTSADSAHGEFFYGVSLQKA